MRKLLKYGLRAFGIGLFCAMLFLLGQAVTLTTQAQLPSTSPGGAINLLSNFPQWIVFNTDSHGTRSYVPVGSILGANFVATDETTFSTGFTDLATADSVTFTCAAVCTVAVHYLANEYSTNAGAPAMFNDVVIDGSQVDDGNQAVTQAGASLPITGAAIWKAASLSAASHTIKIQHKISSAAQTGHWRDRMLAITLTQ